MKTIKRKLLLFAMTLVSGTVLASGEMSVNLIPVKNDKALMAVTSTAQNRFEVEILNENGDIVYMHKAKSPVENYEKVYNLQNLENGQYRFVVRTDNEEIERTLDIKNGNISVVAGEKDRTPFFSFDDRNLKFSYLNFDQKDVHLYVYSNETGDAIYQANLGSGFAITSGLDLSKLKYGSYEVVLASEDFVHPYDIEID
jgi:hypothetical protein